MLVLRVLENVLQPSFLQKMTVLNLLEKISQDSQILIDIFVNYDCDLDAPNIFERYYLLDMSENSIIYQGSPYDMSELQSIAAKSLANDS